MEPRSLKYIAEAADGELHGGQPGVRVERVCTDSRKAQASDLFVALKGEKYDGHDFLGEVAGRGVAAVMAEGSRAGTLRDCAVVAVRETRTALGKLAGRYRLDFELPMIAVGGSNGKTTAKELIASVLRQRFETLASEASFNNEIGVPLTLLQLSGSHKAAVLEVGTNHPGELALLLRMISHRYGVVTSIGEEHLEFFGDLRGVAEEEGWMAELLPADGALFINGDSEWTETIAHRSRARVVRAGLGRGCDFRAESVQIDDTGVTFRVIAPGGKWDGEHRINLIGAHQVGNALLAIAVGAELGLSREEIARGLAACAPPKMRMQLWRANGWRILDDAYNANADSMRAALATLRDLDCAGRRIAVLGDMAELGDGSEAAHREVGKCAAGISGAHLFAIGPKSKFLAKAARASGMKHVQELDDAVKAGVLIREYLREDDLVLVKASRSMRLERVVEKLKS